MIITGEIKVPGKIETIWEAIFNLEILSSCIPGVDTLTQLNEVTYSLEMTQTLGPFKITMAGQQNLTQATRPTHLEMEGYAESKNHMGRVKDGVVMDLTQVGDEVEISYKLTFTMSGKMAALGDRVFRSKAAGIERDFSNNLRAALFELEC